MHKRLLLLICPLAALTLAAPAAEPLGHWPLDGHLDDVAGSANGTFLGGAPSYTKGRIGQAITFDGVDDLLEVMVANLDAYTISAWVKPERADAASIVARTSASGTTTHWSHQVRIAASGVFEHYTYDGAAKAVLGTTPVEVGTWTFVTITATNNGSAQLYVNGQEEGDAVGVGTVWTGGDRFHIGSNSGNAMGWFQGIIDDVQIYDTALSQEEIVRVMKSALQTSSKPIPEDAATDVARDIVLGWSPNETAQTQDVYLGTVFDDVNDASRADDMGVLLSQGQTGLTYDPPGVFEYGQTYYWRVDEVNGAPDNTIFKGEIWSFTIEPLAYPIANVAATSNVEPQPGTSLENIVNGAGLNENDEHSIDSADMWQVTPAAGEPLTIEFAFDAVYKLHEMLVWNYKVQFELMLGFGVKDVTIEYSENGADWAVLGDVAFNQGTTKSDYQANTTVDFGGVAAQHVKITVNSGYGPLGQFGLSEVRFLYTPVQAREPQPDDGAAGVSVDADLSWRSGREAVLHEVYLSTNPSALELIDTTREATVGPGALDLAATYYWQIIEVNEAEPISAWEGAIWSFSTEAYIVVEDFESYDDEESRIYNAWVDGYGVTDNGSTVGHLESPFAEQATIHGGAQSMPLFFDNTNGAAASEAERTLDSAMDWTTYGVKSLSLYFQGAPDNGGQLYIKINGTKVMYDGDAADVTRALWQPWNIDLSTVGGNLSNVTSLTIGIQGAGATGVVYIDDIRLYGKTPEFITPVEPDSADLLVHYTFDGNAADSSGNGTDGEEIGEPIYTDGADGQALEFDGIDDYVNAVLDVPENGGTTAFWFKTTNPNCGLFAIVQNPLGGGGYDRLIYLADGNVGVRIYQGEVITATVNVADGQWHHLVHTYGDAIGGQRLYIDGLLQAQGVKAESDFDWQERVNFGWAADAAEDFFEGALDDARIYGRTLSPEEVAWLVGGETAQIPKPF